MVVRLCHASRPPDDTSQEHQGKPGNGPLPRGGGDAFERRTVAQEPAASIRRHPICR